MHCNYLWNSKVVAGSDVCNRASACTVLHRTSSNIAKVDRCGQVVACGATSMETAVISQGGRVPDSVVVSSGTSVTGKGNNATAAVSFISASYVAARNQQLNNGGAGGAPGSYSCYGGGSSSSVANGNPLMSRLPAGTESRYTYMDEEYLGYLQTQMGWERDNAIIHLMPIAVVYQEDIY